MKRGASTEPVAMSDGSPAFGVALALSHDPTGADGFPTLGKPWATVDRRLAWLIGLTLFLAGALFQHPVDYGNTIARDLLTAAIVDRGTFNIDPWKDRTNDISANPETGHVYANKAIGAPFLGVPAYWLARQEMGRKRLAEELPRGPLYVTRLWTATLPFALAGVLLFLVARGAGLGRWPAVGVAFVYGFGTISWIHATMNSGHTAAAAFCFAGAALLFRAQSRRVAGRPVSLGLYALAGLLVGWGALCDYTAMYIAASLTVYLAWRRPGIAAMAAWCIAGAACVAVMAAYNTACFGGPLSMPMSAANQATGEFAQGAAKGLLGVALPSPTALYYLLFSPARGLFTVMPAMLLAVLGAVRLRRQPAWRPEWVLGVAIVTGYLAINAGFYGWHGGWTYGPRYLTPMLPFLCLGLLAAPRLGWIAAALIGLSVLQVGLATVGMPHAQEDLRNPLLHLIVPLIGDGYLATTPLSALIGLATPAWLGTAATLLLLGGLVAWTLRRAALADAEPDLIAVTIPGDAASEAAAEAAVTAGAADHVEPAAVSPPPTVAPATAPTPSRDERLVAIAWGIAVCLLLAATTERPADLGYYKRAAHLRSLARATGDSRFEAAAERVRQAARDAIEYLPDEDAPPSQSAPATSPAPSAAPPGD